MTHADLDEFPSSWHAGLERTKLFNDTNEASCNRFGVLSGQSLSEWESSGWVNEDDPRGWWQWYFRFYMGRRHEDVSVVRASVKSDRADSMHTLRTHVRLVAG